MLLSEEKGVMACMTKEDIQYGKKKYLIAYLIQSLQSSKEGKIKALSAPRYVKV